MKNKSKKNVFEQIQFHQNINKRFWGKLKIIHYIQSWPPDVKKEFGDKKEF